MQILTNRYLENNFTLSIFAALISLLRQQDPCPEPDREEKKKPKPFAQNKQNPLRPLVDVVVVAGTRGAKSSIPCVSRIEAELSAKIDVDFPACRPDAPYHPRIRHTCLSKQINSRPRAFRVVFKRCVCIYVLLIHGLEPSW